MGKGGVVEFTPGVGLETVMLDEAGKGGLVYCLVYTGSGHDTFGTYSCEHNLLVLLFWGYLNYLIDHS